MGSSDTKIFTRGGRKKAEGLPDYIKLCFPILLFPLLYFPYSMWLRDGFATLAVGLFRTSSIPTMRLLVMGNNTILLFWICVTALVMAASLVVALMKIGKWYAMVVYLAVMFSLCGIFSLWLYTLII